MYISISSIKAALSLLQDYHPFWGVTFLVFKKENLPIGNTNKIPINTKEEDFLKEYYRVTLDSHLYYRVFRPSDKENHWWTQKYPHSGSQKTRTQGDLSKAFIHPRNTDKWGWQENYIEILKNYNKEKIPTLPLALWLFRNKSWSDGTSAQDIVEYFKKFFNITEDEYNEFFRELDYEEIVKLGRFLVNDKVTNNEILRITGFPPDYKQSEGGILNYLNLKGVGPALELEFEASPRLNLITGDNGLGKSFLLDCAWWALSGHWAGFAAFPMNNANAIPTITYQISGEVENTEIIYNKMQQRWFPVATRPIEPALLVYARVDASFAIWDPAKARAAISPPSKLSFKDIKPLLFEKDNVWNGLEISDYNEIFFGSSGYSNITLPNRPIRICNGLISDWVTWQSKPEKYPFKIFKQVLKRLSPNDLGPLEPGDPIRISQDAREMPTIKHPYGDVPIIYAAAGVKRILALAYLIVWAWDEHKRLSEFTSQEPEHSMVIIIDEIESHLHPLWQRIILPALLEISKDLNEKLKIQFIISTHSPFIVASIEPEFDEDKDALFHLSLDNKSKPEHKVQLAKIPFQRYGRIDSWLTSEIFEFKQPLSIDAEKAIEEAKKLQASVNPDTEKIQEVHDKLVKYLSAEDKFWPRWVYFAQQHGVKR